MWVTRQSFFTRKHLFGVQQGVSDLNMFPLPYFSHDQQQYVSDNWSDFFHRIFHVMTNRMWVMLHFFFDILSHSMANSMWVMLLCSARNFHAFHSFIIRLWGTSDFSLNWSLITSDPHDQQRVSVTASFSFPGLCAMTNRMWVTLYFFFYKQCYHISWLAGRESWFCYQEPYSFSAYNQQTVSDSVHLDRAAPPHTYILSYYYCTASKSHSMYSFQAQHILRLIGSKWLVKSLHISSHGQQEVSRVALLQINLIS